MGVDFKTAFLAEIKAAGELRYNSVATERKYAGMANKSQIKRLINEMVEAGEITKRTFKKIDNGKYSTFIFFSLNDVFSETR